MTDGQRRRLQQLLREAHQLATIIGLQGELAELHGRLAAVEIREHLKKIADGRKLAIRQQSRLDQLRSEIQQTLAAE